jgi:hypothetical protein
VGVFSVQTIVAYMAVERVSHLIERQISVETKIVVQLNAERIIHFVE